MKIQELICEEINLIPFHNEIYDAIARALPEAVENIEFYQSAYEDQRDEITQSASFKTLIKMISPVIIELLEQGLTHQLESIGVKMTNGALDYVNWAQLNGANGHVENRNGIVLNTKFLTMLAEPVTKTIYRHLFDVVDSADELFDALFSISLAEDEVKQMIALADDPIESLTTTFTHEAVHVVQGARQPANQDQEYRSYKDNKKKKQDGKGEFYRLASIPNGDRTPGQTARWKELYHASPQEIAAFAHNIAQNIISTYKLRQVDPSNHQLMHGIFRMIPMEVKNYLKPNTPQEYKIYNRYVKISTKVLQSYIDMLIARQK